MATIEGTIIGIVFDKEDPQSEDVKIARFAVTVPVYEDGADSFRLSAVGAAISARKRNGKTATTIAAMASGRGTDGAGTKFQVGALTKASDTFTGNLILGDGGTTEADAPTGVGLEAFSRPLLIDVSYTEA